jgi:NAD(P)-dependent dehydrogenase (short-subunit alcohol dehydrogenase family)
MDEGAAEALSLEGRVAVITGAASGIGAATARLMAARGARLALVDRDPLEGAPAGALCLRGDVGAPGEVAAHGARVREALGGIDVLVTAAGWSDGRDVPEGDFASWRAVLGTVLDGTYLWAGEAIRSMRAGGRGGAIVTVASQLALAGGRSNAAYLAGKGAVLSLTRCMALDHAAEGIRVNAVVPGAVDTPLLARAFARAPDPEAARDRSVARHPMGRLGRAEEIAEAVAFLASDAASFTTGAALAADGGWLAA